MKLNSIFILLIFSSCLVIPEKYLNEDTFGRMQTKYAINIQDLDLDELSRNYEQCANFYEKADRDYLSSQIQMKKNRLKEISALVNIKFERSRIRNTNFELNYNVSINEIYCENNYIDLDRERNNNSSNMLSFLLLGVIPIVVSHDTYFLILIKNENHEEILRFVVIHDQKSIFSIFTAPFSILIDHSEKRQNRIINSIAEKIFIETYLRLDM